MNKMSGLASLAHAAQTNSNTNTGSSCVCHNRQEVKERAVYTDPVAQRMSVVSDMVTKLVEKLPFLWAHRPKLAEKIETEIVELMHNLNVLSLRVDQEQTTALATDE